MNTPSNLAENAVDVAIIGAGPAGLTAAYLLSCYFRGLRA